MNSDANHNTHKNRTTVIDLVNDLNIKAIDIHDEIFKVESDPMSLFPFRVHGHYTKDAYEKIALLILSKINNNKRN